MIFLESISKLKPEIPVNQALEDQWGKYGEGLKEMFLRRIKRRDLQLTEVKIF